MEFQNDIKRKEQLATQRIAEAVQGLVEKIAQEQKLSGVFESNTAGLLYLKDPVNLTKDVIARYSKEAKPAPQKKEEKKK